MSLAHATRRQFLRRSAAAAGALAFPTIVPSSVFGADAPSNRVHVAAIGVGGQGSGLLSSYAYPSLCQVVAVCDCFQDRRERAVALVNGRFGATGCRPYRDFREMLEREDIEGVYIATPDHWHVPIALWAVRAGKDVYVEKPLGLSMEQNQVMRKACREHGAVFQYGTMQRSMKHVRRGCELVRNGRIGKILSIEVVCPGGVAGGSTTPAPVPDGLNYDQWLGPAPWAPYTPDRCTNLGAYHISDYALGFIAGWGAHPLDVMIWGLGGGPASVPVRYEGTGVFPAEGLFDTALSWEVRGELADGARFEFRGPGVDLTVFRGERGVVSISRGGWSAEPASLMNEVLDPGEIHLMESEHQPRQFMRAIRTRGPTVSPVEDAVYSDTISHLSDIAIRAGRVIRWDPVKEQIQNDPSASRMLSRPLRAPWHL